MRAKVFDTLIINKKFLITWNSNKRSAYSYKAHRHLIEFFRDKADFDAAVKEVLAQKIKDGDVEKIIKEKSRRRTENWKRVLQEHRDFELSKMKECFGSRDFLNAMHDFVYKKRTWHSYSVKIDECFYIPTYSWFSFLFCFVNFFITPLFKQFSKNLTCGKVYVL